MATKRKSEISIATVADKRTTNDTLKFLGDFYKKLAEMEAKSGVGAKLLLTQQLQLQRAQLAEQKRAVDAAKRMADDKEKYLFRIGERSKQQYINRLRSEEQAESASYARRIRLMQERQRIEATMGPAQSPFARAVLSSRFSLPGTNGNVMPLVGQTLRGGVGAVGGMAAIGLASLASKAVRDGIAEASDLESALNKLQGRTGATNAQLQQLRQTARELGKDITLPGIASTDAAEAIQGLSQKGLSLQDSMAGAKGALQLAIIAEEDFKLGAIQVAEALNQFGLAGDQATRVADIFASAVKKGVRVQDLAEALQNVGPIAKQFGLTLEDTVTILAQFDKQGLKGAESGTNLKTMLQRLENPTKKAADELERLGVKIVDSTGKYRPYRDILADLSKATDRLSQAKKAEAMGHIFGTRAVLGANIAVTDGVKAYDAYHKAISTTGEATKQTEAQTRGLKGALDQLDGVYRDLIGSQTTDSGLVKFLAEGVTLGTSFIGILDNILTRAEKLGDKGGALGVLLKQMQEVNAEAKAILKGADDDKAASGSASSRFRVATEDKKTALGLLKSGKMFSATERQQAEIIARRYGVTDIPVVNGNYTDPAMDPSRQALESVIPAIINAMSASRRDAQTDDSETRRLKARSSRESGEKPKTGPKDNTGKTDPKEAEKLARQQAEAKASAAQFDSQRAQARLGQLVQDYKGRYTVGLGGDPASPEVKALESGAKERAKIEKAISDALLVEKKAIEARYQADVKNDPAGAREKRRQALIDAEEQRAESLRALATADFKQLERINKDNAEAEISKMEAQLKVLQDEYKEAFKLLEKSTVPEQRALLADDAGYASRQILLQERSLAIARRRKATGEAGSPVAGALTDQTIALQESDKEASERTKEITDAVVKATKEQDEKLRKLSEERLDFEREQGRVGTLAYLAELKRRVAATEEGTEERLQAERKLWEATRDEQDRAKESLLDYLQALGYKKRREREPTDTQQAFYQLSGNLQGTATNAFSDILRGKGSSKRTFDEIGLVIGDSAAQALTDGLVKRPLDRFFNRLGDRLSEKIKIGGEEAGAALAAAATAVMAINQAKKGKFGALLGTVAGAFIGGFGGAAIGGQIGGLLGFADGGIPPLNRAVRVGEDGPELAVNRSGIGLVGEYRPQVRSFSETTRIFDASTTRAIANMGGLGGGGITINGPLMQTGDIHDRADATFVTERVTEELTTVGRRSTARRPSGG